MAKRTSKAKPKSKPKSKPKKSVKKKAVKKKVQKPAQAKTPKIKGTLVGHVTHFFGHVSAAAVKIEKGNLKVGDRLYFKGHTTDFEQVMESLQVDHVGVQKAGKGAEVGIAVKARVREGDAVYKR